MHVFNTINAAHHKHIKHILFSGEKKYIKIRIQILSVVFFFRLLLAFKFGMLW